MVRYVLQRESDGMYLQSFMAACGFGDLDMMYSFYHDISDAFHFEDEEQADMFRNFLIVYCPSFRSDLVMRSVTKVVPVKKSQQPPKEV